MPPSTLRQQAYQHLRQRLLTGELTAGTQLSEPDLAKQLGMSRTPVREALRQMENEGLLEYAPRFGATVRVPDRDELAEMYSVREALESYAAGEAAQRMTPHQVHQLEEAFDAMCKLEQEFQDSHDDVLEGDLLRRFIAADMTFHRHILAAASNRYLTKIVDDTRLLVRVFTATFWQYDAQKLSEANRFHGKLLDAMQTRDSETACATSAEAMRVARANAITAWDKQVQGASRF